MISLLFYYVGLPMVLFAVTLKIIRRYGGNPVPRDIQQLISEKPLEPKTFRVVKIEGSFGRPEGFRMTVCGDYDAQDKAVDAAFAESKKTAPKNFSTLVLNEKGEALQEFNSSSV